MHTAPPHEQHSLRVLTLLFLSLISSSAARTNVCVSSRCVIFSSEFPSSRNARHRVANICFFILISFRRKILLAELEKLLCALVKKSFLILSCPQCRSSWTFFSVLLFAFGLSSLTFSPSFYGEIICLYYQQPLHLVTGDADLLPHSITK